MIRPPGGINGNAALVKSTGPVTLLSKMSEKSSGVNSGVGTIEAIAALWTTVMSRPNIFLIFRQGYAEGN